MNLESQKTVLIIISVIVLIVIIIFLCIRNTFIEKSKKNERNKSLIDVYLKKRYDLIPNLVEICKGYSKYENDTLEKIIKLRNSFNENSSDELKEELNNYYQKIIVLAESYPELKASEQYLNLQRELVNVENELQAARRIYINGITSYNNLVMKFPSSIIGKICGYKTYELPKFITDDNFSVKFND